MYRREGDRSMWRELFDVSMVAYLAFNVVAMVSLHYWVNRKEKED